MSDLKEGGVYEAPSHKEITKVMRCLRESLGSGWIDREGHFWGCDFEAHDDILGLLFGSERGVAEREGWVHIHPWMWWCDREMTDAQEKTLVDIGRDLFDMKYRDENLVFADVFPDGYPLGLLPNVKITPYRARNSDTRSRAITP